MITHLTTCKFQSYSFIIFDLNFIISFCSHELQSSCREQIIPLLPAIPVHMNFMSPAGRKSDLNFLPYLGTNDLFDRLLRSRE